MSRNLFVAITLAFAAGFPATSVAQSTDPAQALHRLFDSRFDLRDFDDAVLETGSVPLDVLERHIDDWIAARKPATAH